MITKDTLLRECSKMVVGMVDYYSHNKIDTGSVEEALRPLLEALRRDDKGYLDYVKAYKQSVKDEDQA